MAKMFNDFIQRKIQLGVLYQHTFKGNDICGNCIYRRPFQNFCRKFNKKIQKVGQSNGGFHHSPCENCLKYKIQKIDINYYINSYKRKFPNREIGEIDYEKHRKD